MKRLQFATAVLVALGVRSAAGQDQTLFPPPAVEEQIEAGREEAQTESTLQTERMLEGSGIPYSPYPAGLTYTMAPQPFRVPFPDRIYYPPAHYVRLCPYFSKGVYWGADWNKRLLGCNPWLIHGDKRFNPYLTQAKIQHHAAKNRRSAPASHYGPGPGHSVYFAPPLAEAKSSRRASKSVQLATASSEPVESMSKSRRETVRSTSRRKSQVQFVAAGGDEPEDAPEAPEVKPTAKSAAKPANRAAGRTLPTWQRPPAVHR